MMKYIHNWKNTIISRLAMLALLLTGGVSVASADTTLSVEDFSIAPGETKSVTVNLDTDETGIFLVSADFKLPAGLEFVTKSANSTKISTTRNAERAGGDFTVDGSTNTNRIALTSLSMNTITGTTGAIFTFKVKATSDLASGVSTLGISDYKIKKTNGDNITATVKGAKVTKINTAEEGEIALAFSPSTLTLAPGATTSIAVTMDNPGVEVEGMQVDLDIPTGWTYTITNGRLTNDNPNDGTNNRVITRNPVEGESGTIFTLNLTAPATFSGSALIGLTNIRPTVNGETLSGVEDASLVVTSDGSTPIVGGASVSFGTDAFGIEAGQTKSVDVNLTNLGIEVEGLQANIEVPEGWTFTLTDGRLENTNPNDGSSTRVITYSTIEGESGAIFTLNLKAPATFTTGTAVARVVNVRATINGKTVVLDPISVTMKANNPADLATVMGWVDGLQEKLDNAIETIEKEYPEAAEDEDLLREEQIIQQGIVDLHAAVQEAYDNGELNPDDFKGTVKELSDAIDNLLYEAKEIQDKAGNKDNEAGKAALDDEIAALQKKLDDAKDEIPSDLPKDATKELSDDADAIQDQIDALKAQVEQDYKDGKLTPDSKLDPEKKQKVLDDIDALLKKIHTWLRGDVDNDGDVDMDDFYALKKLISEEKTPTDAASNFFYRCDANADGEINVGDLQGILNICVGLKASGK